MRQLQPVIWMKGTLLSPQHLQTQDRFIESTLRFQTEALAFAAWGFDDVRIDHEQLSNGNLAIAEARGMLPDGLMFEIPVADPPPPPKLLAEAFDPDQKELDIYLCIPESRIPGMNISLATKKDAATRYYADVAMLRDENNGTVEKPVQMARKNFRLLTGNEAREGYSTIRVARVKRHATGTLELDQRFVPPLLDVAGSEYLMAITRRLVEILAAKSSMLAGGRRQKNLSLADFGTADIANFWLLYTINSHFPIFQHLLEVRRGHPAKLYETMLSLAGAMTTFSTTMHPRDLPKYDHDNLAGCFTELDEMIRNLLETVIPSNFISLPLKLLQPSIWGTPLAEDRFLKNTRLYLSVTSEMNEAEIITKVPHLIKLCSANHIEHLVRQALPGVPLTHVPRPPSGVPAKLNSQYFSLDQSPGGMAWEAITRSRNLAAYVPADFPRPQLELIILLPEGAK
jgi:type VI secretion system protein ImpJ